jgi:hypothetical protein
VFFDIERLNTDGLNITEILVRILEVFLCLPLDIRMNSAYPAPRHFQSSSLIGYSCVSCLSVQLVLNRVIVKSPRDRGGCEH